MVRRTDDDADETPTYRLYPESELIGDGDSTTVAPPRWGLDFNRSHPHNWQPEYRQSGAGPYPYADGASPVRAAARAR